MTWHNANSGNRDDLAEVYIDGIRRGWLEGYRAEIGLGQRYRGTMDDLLILDARPSDPRRPPWKSPGGDDLEAKRRVIEHPTPLI